MDIKPIPSKVIIWVGQVNSFLFNAAQLSNLFDSISESGVQLRNRTASDLDRCQSSRTFRLRVLRLSAILLVQSLVLPVQAVVVFLSAFFSKGSRG